MCLCVCVFTLPTYTTSYFNIKHKKTSVNLLAHLSIHAYPIKARKRRWVLLQWGNRAHGILRNLSRGSLWSDKQRVTAVTPGGWFPNLCLLTQFAKWLFFFCPFFLSLEKGAGNYWTKLVSYEFGLKLAFPLVDRNTQTNKRTRNQLIIHKNVFQSVKLFSHVIFISNYL